MANVDAPRGLRWVRSLTGHKKPPMITIDIDSADTPVYMGALIEMDASTGYGQMPNAAALKNASQIVGVAAGYIGTVSSGQTELPVILGRGQVFEIQAGASTTAFDTEAEILIAIASANRYGFLAGASGVSGLNVSAMELDASAAGTTAGTHIFHIVDWPERPLNALGDNIKLHVRIHDSEIIESFQA